MGHHTVINNIIKTIGSKRVHKLYSEVFLYSNVMVVTEFVEWVLYNGRQKVSLSLHIEQLIGLAFSRNAVSVFGRVRM